MLSSENTFNLDKSEVFAQVSLHADLSQNLLLLINFLNVNRASVDFVIHQSYNNLWVKAAPYHRASCSN